MLYTSIMPQLHAYVFTLSSRNKVDMISDRKKRQAQEIS